MIIYRMNPLPVHLKNTMVLDDNEGMGILYVGASTYKQATLLQSRFSGDVSRLITNITNESTKGYREVPGLMDAIERAKELLPQPLNMLAAFLIYCSNNKGIDWTDVTDLFIIGTIHQFSQIVDFNAVALQPAAVQAEITIPSVFLKQYQESWDMLTETLETLVIPETIVQPTYVPQYIPTPMPTQAPTPVVQQTPMPTPVEVTTQTSVVAEEPAPSDDSEDEEEDPAEAARIAKLMAELEEFNNKADEQLDKLDKQANGGADKTKKDATSNNAGNDSSKLGTDENAEYVKEANAVLDEFDV